jgi:hypothetical protein
MRGCAVQTIWQATALRQLAICGLALVLGGDVARSDEIDQCIAKKQTAFEAPQQFAQDGEITCPAGDIVGFPPRIRRDKP